MAARSSGGARAQAARVAEVIAPVVGEAGFDLEDVTVSRVGRRHLVKVIIDGDGGVDLDATAAVSRAASRALDDAEQGGDTFIHGEYVLEVSSPGVQRPLTEPRHWRRNVGRLVITPVVQQGVTQYVTGRVIAAGDASVVLDVDGDHREVEYDLLGAGRVQVEMRRDGEDAGQDPGEGEPT